MVPRLSYSGAVALELLLWTCCSGAVALELVLGSLDPGDGTRECFMEVSRWLVPWVVIR